MSTTTATEPAHTVYGVYARHNGKPSGFCGYYRTKAEAQASDHGRAGARIKRETMTAVQWQRWEASGFKSRTGWAA